MCAAAPASPPMSRNVLHFWGGSCSSSPPPDQQRSESLRKKNEIIYRRNGEVIHQKGLCFEKLLAELSALVNAGSAGAAVDAVELIFLGQRLKEQQCEALASRISGNIFLKKVLDPFTLPRFQFSKYSVQSLICWGRCRLIASTNSISTRAFSKPPRTLTLLSETLVSWLFWTQSFKIR